MSTVLQEALRALNKQPVKESLRDKKGNIIDSEWLEYRIEGLSFVKDIIEGKFDEEECRRYYYDKNEYNFDKIKPRDSIETLIYRALRDRLGLTEATDKKLDDIDADRDDKVEKAKDEFDKTRDDADADKDDKLEKKNLKESSEYILSTEEFLNWHDNEADPRADEDIIDQVYMIFDDAGCDENEYVDVCYDSLSDEDKLKITKLIKSKYDLDEAKKTIGQELKDDQEWIDYDMEHDHHISKATQKDIEDQGLQIEKDQYGDYEVTAGHYDEAMNEDIASSVPTQPLPRDELYAAIEAVKPGSYVHAGYLNDVTKSMVASKYTGGRKSTAEDPVVVIYKATEIYGRCGIEYENIQSIKDRRAAGIERQGNKYEIESELGNKIYRVPSTGSELLQIYPRSRGDVKVRYFISINGEDLRIADREELALYSRASSLAPHSGDFDPGKPMRLNLSKIYWFKNLGHSIM